jgi:hypothetical protein
LKVTLAGTFSKITSLADRSYKLEFTTRELGQDVTKLMDMIHKEGWLLLSPNDDLSEADIPDEKADSMTGQKTQAQRLRSTIYVMWEQKGKPGNSEDFYRSYMESIIEKVKAKLD